MLPRLHRQPHWVQRPEPNGPAEAGRKTRNSNKAARLRQRASTHLERGGGGGHRPAEPTPPRTGRSEPNTTCVPKIANPKIIGRETVDPLPGELARPITLRDKLACVWKQLLAAPSQISVAVGPTFRIENRARSVSWRFPGFRFGSATAYCEVRLADLELAEEACRLQRCGRTWHLVPLGPKGSILVQDRPIEGPYPLPFDVPFRIGSICFTLRQNRSSDPDWEMYRTLSSAQHRRPMSINPLPVSLPAVERCIASIAPPRSQQGIVHESSIPLAPRIESPLERSTSPRPVNPWEARWKAAGARLQAERKQPLPPGRPHPSPPADRSERPSQGTISSFVQKG